jgi:hypothetical protein
MNLPFAAADARWLNPLSHKPRSASLRRLLRLSASEHEVPLRRKLTPAGRPAGGTRRSKCGVECVRFMRSRSIASSRGSWQVLNRLVDAWTGNAHARTPNPSNTCP